MMTTPAYVARMSISALGVLGTAPVISREKKTWCENKCNAKHNEKHSVNPEYYSREFLLVLLFLFNPKNHFISFL
jgi:hypothetical protein